METVVAATENLLELPVSFPRRVRFLVPTDHAVVLGSTQPEAHVDTVAARAASVAVLRRRTGGSAVLVAPEQVLWADVLLPAGDSLWSPDVGRAFWWLGEAWVAALAAVGVGGAEVWRGPLVRTAWSDRICFAGLGPGEVTVRGAKAVGLSQRRTRHGALFQCAVAVEWSPGDLVALLALDRGRRDAAVAELAPAVHAVGAIARRLPEAFVACLP